MCDVSLQEVLEKKHLTEEQVKEGDTGDKMGAQAAVPPEEALVDMVVDQPVMAAQLPPGPVEGEQAAGEDRANYEQLNLDLKKGLDDGQEAAVRDEQFDLDPKKSLEEDHEHRERKELGKEENSPGLGLKQLLRKEAGQEFEEAEMVGVRVKKRELGGEVEKGGEMVLEQETKEEEEREVVETDAVGEELGKDDMARKVRDLKTVAADS